MSVGILIVDDEPDVADLFRQRFRGLSPRRVSFRLPGVMTPTAKDSVRPSTIQSIHWPEYAMGSLLTTQRGAEPHDRNQKQL